MKKLILLLLLTSCIQLDAIPQTKEGNIVCYWNDNITFSGTIELQGEGLQRGNESYLDGEWGFCNNKDVLCIVKVNTSTIGQ